MYYDISVWQPGSAWTNGGELTALYIGEEREVKGVLEWMGGVTAGNDRQGLCSFKNSIGSNN